MKNRLRPACRLMVCIAIMIMAVGCADRETYEPEQKKEVIEKTVAVVMPMNDGLDLHWQRSLALFERNFERAFRNQAVAVKLRFELYDEWSLDMKSLAEELAGREDIYAVVGGLYSSDASILAGGLNTLGKTFFTLATAEELVRAYSSTGNLWAMTETDITQCEVLLSKVVNYGGSSVALIAKDDIYGKTFTDWFAFQARELGLENKGVFIYDDDSLEEMSRQAMQSGASYVICVPSEIEEIGPMLDDYLLSPGHEESGPAPRRLFSDMAFGTDVLSIFGEKAEGMEGVAFGADPESGFDVSYRTFFGVAPTVGEAQLYDAVMLTGYAAWHQYLNPQSSLQNSLRRIVSGEDLNMGSWTGEDMGLVVDAMARGEEPYVRGASGHLRFDSKIFTNVLATTYYNFKVYDGRYLILDYNTSNGGNRTDATLAGWNWKATGLQDFEDSGNISYPPHKSNWALLVAASDQWVNYRHQADVMAIYQQLKKTGYPDERIILILEDDIAAHVSNPEPGVVRIRPGGENVYRDVEIDYRLSDLTPDDFLAILKGEKGDRLPSVIESTSEDNVFVFWSGHGVPGGMCWQDDPYGMTGDVLSDTLSEMYANGRFRKLLMMIEACYSGGVARHCEGIPGTLLVTAANEDETSKADIFSGDLRVWMSNRFTSTFIEQIAENSSVSLRDLYYRLFLNTVGSHVMVYNARNFGSLYSSDMSEFINFK